ncbi:putative extracellular serine-rich protein [Daldinia childiae]|uniref:putative extracellular serine-rich protein n=1 Tax=Daldinia childiae TaxID=326645 RepID=UPI0014467AA2|nr:putative extracellular serine-rich protein [Daldinia childiae]KAF3070460.1 putative extracellular serine-rich protein [Daldinia childiae]
MHFSTSTAALLTLLGSAAAQNVHVVSVGSPNGTLIFSPDNIKADVGDMIQFQFRGGNHSVAQSNFDNPCTPISDHTNQTGIFSGYQPVAASKAMGMIPTYTVKVSAKTPLWFYCSQGKHCQNGMVMVVNENTSANATRSLSNFKDIAKGAAANIAPSTTTGGSAGNGTSSGGSESGSGSGSGSDSGSGSGSGTDSGSGTGSGSDSGSGSGTDSTATESSAPVASATSSTSAIPTAAANIVGASSSMGLLGLVAALFML